VNRTEDRWRAVRTYQQLRPKSVSLSDELQEEADRLIKERETLQSKDESDYSQDDENRIEEIKDRLEAIEATTRIFTPKQKSISGVMIGITFNGQLAADHGLTQQRVSIDSNEGSDAPAKAADPMDPEKLSGSLQEDDLLAFVVAQTINTVQLPHQKTGEGHLRASIALSNALGLDMANWWSPTAENYFQRIKKDQILAAIKDASGLPVPDRLMSLKKSDLAQEAEAIVKGSRWLPPVLRG
jgi:hypothetical protein